VAHHAHDDGFHEIQLNGKQLVFLFMAATVVSVVIFLCGVLVGRGVRAERAVAEASAANADPALQPATAPPTQPPAGSDPTAAAPPPPEDLSYFSRLEKSTGPAEQLKPTAATDRKSAPAEKGTSVPASLPAAAPPKADAPKAGASKAEASKAEAPKAEAAKADTPKSEPAKPAPPKAAPPRPEPAHQADAAAAEPSGQGFAVQIAALNVRSEADAIARRLSSKGYSAYVISPATGTPVVYRVRVGKFPTRREAESVAARLQKEEQFKPWVTR
jgi:cell division septation protein DedD